MITLSSTRRSFTSASMVRKDRPSAAHLRRSSSLPGFMRNLRQASASFVELPSEKGRMLASEPPLAPTLHKPTKART